MSLDRPNGTPDAGAQAATADMRRNFTDRDDLVAYVADAFPAAARRDRHVSPLRGGRGAAETVLAAVNPAAYAATRNVLDGKATRLGPYLRYGVLSLAEVRDAVINRVRRRGESQQLIEELAWRDYFQRLYRQLGKGIWDDREPYKTGYAAAQYAVELPRDIREGATGLPCLDAFIRELRETGYLHNHARLWLAAYVVHWRGVRWQAGAAWFLEHLLCGDPASNNLSWQWVASTFGHKPYIFNRENLEQHSEGVYCRSCPHYGRCDFEGTYGELQSDLFAALPG